MADIATQTVNSGGLNATYAAAAASHRFTPGTLLHVKNANASPCNVTLVTEATIDGNAIADKVVAVPNAQERFIWVPVDPIYRDSAGLVQVQFSITASVTVAAVAPTSLQ
jgi:hypothetical protein